MKLYKYRCSTCGKIWYEEEVSSSVHHGCPDGCDDAGEYLGYVEMPSDLYIHRYYKNG